MDILATKKSVPGLYNSLPAKVSRAPSCLAEACKVLRAVEPLILNERETESLITWHIKPAMYAMHAWNTSKRKRLRTVRNDESDR